MDEAQKTQIKAVLFDFGGVIAEEGFHEGLEAIAGYQGLQPDLLPRMGMDAVYESGYVVGRGSERAFWSLLRQRAGISGSDASLRSEVLSRFLVRPWAIELVRKLRLRGYLTALLSDQTDWLEQLDRRQGFLKEFDRVFVSCYLGKGKRDATLFDDVMALLELPPGQAVFIDDAPGNIDRARSRGLHGLLYTDRANLESALQPLLG